MGFVQDFSKNIYPSIAALLDSNSKASYHTYTLYDDRKMPAFCVRSAFPLPDPVRSLLNHVKITLSMILFKNNCSNGQRGSENMNNANADILKSSSHTPKNGNDFKAV